MAKALSTERVSLVEKFAARYSLDPKNLMNILKATAFKQGKDKQSVTNEQMAALLVVADQYKLNPFTKEIYAYPDKGGIVPIVGVDGWSRIINEHPELDGLEFRQSEVMVTPDGGKTCPEWMESVIYRKDRSKPIIVREYIDEVYKKTSYASPWQTHTKRFFRHKTLIQGARIAFGYTGIYDQDEADNIIEGQIVEHSSTNEVQAADSAIEAAKPTEETSEINQAINKLAGAKDRNEADTILADSEIYEFSAQDKERLKVIHADRINELTDSKITEDI